MRTQFKMHKKVVVFLTVAIGSAAAMAQEADEGSAGQTAASTRSRLEEVVVTAEKRTESIKDMPVAISAYSEEALMDRGIDSINVLQQISPSLQIQSTINSYANVTIRGIGTHIQNIQGEPSAAVSQDGVAYSDLELANLDFFDIERVEVLRGPQGTLGGRNATAGAINVYTNRPTQELTGSLKTTVGNYNRLGVESVLSGPLVGDRLLGRLALRSDRDDGWLDVVNQGTRLGNRDKLQARGRLLALLSENVELDLILELTRDRSKSALVDAGRVRPEQPSAVEVFGLAPFDWDSRRIELDQPQVGNSDLERKQTIVKLGWDLGQSAKLTATTGYIDQQLTSAHDLDGTAIGGFTVDPLDPLTFDIWQLSQEVNLIADLTDRLDVIVGGQYLRTTAEHSNTFGLPAVGVSMDAIHNSGERKLSSWAAYTQWRYRLSEQLRATAGIRYTHDSKEAHADRFFLGALTGSRTDRGSWSAWTPRFALEYAPTDDLTLYASASRGFKSGGLALFVNPPNPFSPESVWNYELGLKGNWLGDRLRTALTGFYMDYTDLQQVLSGVDPTLPQATRILNAESATIYGTELELEALLSDRLRLTFGGTWLNATYGKFGSHDPIYPELGEPVVSGGPNVRNLEGNRVMLAPEWQFNVSSEYRAPLPGGDMEAVMQVSYTWQDRVFHDVFNNELVSQDPYGLVNLSAAMETLDGAWQFSAYVHNLTDEFDRASLLFLNLPTGQALVSNPGRPRMYGVSLAYRF